MKIYRSEGRMHKMNVKKPAPIETRVRIELPSENSPATESPEKAQLPVLPREILLAVLPCQHVLPEGFWAQALSDRFVQ